VSSEKPIDYGDPKIIADLDGIAEKAGEISPNGLVSDYINVWSSVLTTDGFRRGLLDEQGIQEIIKPKRTYGEHLAHIETSRNSPGYAARIMADPAAIAARDKIERLDRLAQEFNSVAQGTNPQTFDDEAFDRLSRISVEAMKVIQGQF